MLGEGAQGSVWKADDLLHPEQPRALKLVRLAATRRDDAERVRREARGLSTLKHASLVSCHALFEDLKLGVLGMALDFVDGQSLGKALVDSRLTDRHRVKALCHVARALAYVHGEGHLHRDLKLDNVLVTQKFYENPEEPSNVKLVDFGIARFGVVDQALTATNAIVGTMTYIAPELLDPRFFGAKEPSPAADVFAFGVMAHKISARRPPNGLAAGLEPGRLWRRLSARGRERRSVAARATGFGLGRAAPFGSRGAPGKTHSKRRRARTARRASGRVFPRHPQRRAVRFAPGPEPDLGRKPRRDALAPPL